MNHEFRLTDDATRARYLRNASHAFRRSDWKPLAYALMSSHIHWVMLAGTAPPHRVFHPAHTGFAQWLNRRQARLGPVFANRFRTIDVKGSDAAALLAYVHNNPVRARVVPHAEDSTWTSHRAIVDLDPAPNWLDVGTALEIGGLPNNEIGRHNFRDLVRSRESEPSQALWSKGRAVESAFRQRLGTSHLHISQVDASIEDNRSAVMATLPADTALSPPWPGSPRTVVHSVGFACSIDPDELRSASRRRHIVKARRLALSVWTCQLGRAAFEMAAALGISSSAASQLLARADESVALHAEEIARSIRKRGVSASET